MSTKVLIVDDHEVVRLGIKSLLAGSNIIVVGDAANGEQALAAIKAHKPDVILLDVRMPDSDGLTTLSRLRMEDSAVKVLMLSTYDNPTYVARAVALGANGYLLKSASREDLVTAIEKAAGKLGVTGPITLRMTGTEAFVTDGGHLILDASFGRIPDTRAMSQALHAIPGVVEHGLFLDLASAAVLAGARGVRTLSLT